MRTLAIILIAAALGGCGAHVQTTSGAEYLARYDAEAAATRRIGAPPADGTGRRTTRGMVGDLDPAIREAASVEPILRFPARIGLARIEGQELTGIPPEEAAIWHALAERYRKLGTFVPVEPLVAHYAARSIQAGARRSTATIGATRIASTIDTIRVGAARQHLDAVLIYAVGQRGSKSNTVLSVFDITIIGGAILPTREIEIEGLGRALLMDVRNGYPYGTADASVDLAEYSPSFGSDARTEDLRRQAVLKVTEKLAGEVDTMLRDLVIEMSTRVATR